MGQPEQSQPPSTVDQLFSALNELLDLFHRLLHILPNNSQVHSIVSRQWADGSERGLDEPGWITENILEWSTVDPFLTLTELIGVCFRGRSNLFSTSLYGPNWLYTPVKAIAGSVRLMESESDADMEQLLEQPQ